MTTYDAWKLATPSHYETADGPCVCEDDPEDHDVDEEGNVACTGRECAPKPAEKRCTEYREAQPCEGCRAMPWQRCGCDDAYDRLQDGD